MAKTATGKGGPSREKKARKEIEARLAELENAMDAILSGHVDALIVQTPTGEQLYTLEGEERPYRLFVENMGQGAITVSGEGLIDYANARFGQLVGTSTDRIMGTQARGWFLAAPSVLDQLTRGPGRAVVEVSLQGAGGVHVPVEASAWSLPALSGAPRRGVLVADLSAHHAQRERLRSANEDLERRIEDRTRRLREANRELEEFVHSASHDLRAPLRALEGFSRALAQSAATKLDETERGHLARVEGAARQMGMLLDALLELSRISRGDKKPERLDVSAMATDIAEGLARAEPGRKVEVRVQPGLFVTADPELFRSALVNLVENAWKFTRTRTTGRIEVTGERVDGRFALHVKDNGVGFDMAFADRLFRPFSRLHAVREYAGTGVGLVSVLRVAQRHGGRAWGEGKPDQGATFHIEIDETPARNGVPPS